jgi:hypothetical protein
MSACQLIAKIQKNANCSSHSVNLDTEFRNSRRGFRNFALGLLKFSATILSTPKRIMVMKSIVPIAITSLALGLSSCGMKTTMANFKEKITPDIKMPEMKMPEVKRGDIARFSFRDLLPSSVPIVEVDTQKLKEIETGKQKAMAYQNSRRSYFGTWFGGPADFKEPELPSGMLDNPEFSLLPPKPE